MNTEKVTKKQDKDDNTDLKRSLSYRQVTMIALGSALGTGLFLGSKKPISIAGPAVIVIFAIASIIVGIIAACLGELSSRFPLEGGFGTLTAKFLGPYAGFTTRWMYWCAAVIAIGSEVSASSIYISWWFPQIPVWLSALAVALLIGIINYFSVHSFGVAEYFLSSIKVIALIAFIGLGALFVIFGFPRTPATGVTNLFNDGGFMPQGLSSLWIALPFALFSFIGIELVSVSAGEAKEPARSVKTSMKQLIWRLTFFYVVPIFLVVCIVPWKKLASEDSSVSTSPFVEVFSYVGGNYAASITNFVILVAAISSANATLYGATRLLHSLAKDQMSPRPVAQTSSRKVPVIALVLSMSGALIAVGLKLFGTQNVYLYLLTAALCGILVVWVFVLLAFIKYKTDKKYDSNTVKNSPAESDYFRFCGNRKGLSIFLACIALVGVIASSLVGLVNPFMNTALIGGIILLALLTFIYFFISLQNGKQKVSKNS